jgi:hypothetical protein
VSAPRHELLLSAGMVAVSLFVAAGLEWRRDEAERQLAARRTQLQQLAELRRDAARHGLDSDVDLSTFVGLFAGQTLVVTGMAHGNCLILRAQSQQEQR